MKKIILVSIVQLIFIGVSYPALAESPEVICQGTVDVIKKAANTQGITEVTPTIGISIATGASFVDKNKYDVKIEEIKNGVMTISFEVDGVPGDTSDEAKKKAQDAIQTLKFKSISANFRDLHQVACNYDIDFTDAQSIASKPTSWANIWDAPN